MRRNNRLLFIFLYFFSILFAQNQELFLLDFLKAVRDFHPLSLRAGFEKEMAYARFLSAHQLIEPRIEADVKSKGFEEKNYYDKTKVGVVLPIWYGLELEAGWMENTGAKLGNEETLGQSSYVGGVWRLGKFFSDSARYEFQQAKLGKKYAIENQKIQLKTEKDFLL